MSLSGKSSNSGDADIQTPAEEQGGTATVVKDEDGIGRFQVLSKGGAQMVKGFELKGR